jgi:hypothetical protein
MNFRYDYRLNDHRETLVVGRYDPLLPSRKPRDADQLSFGMSISLAEARLLPVRAAGRSRTAIAPHARKLRSGPRPQQDDSDVTGARGVFFKLVVSLKNASLSLIFVSDKAASFTQVSIPNTSRID